MAGVVQKAFLDMMLSIVNAATGQVLTIQQLGFPVNGRFGNTDVAVELTRDTFSIYPFSIPRGVTHINGITILSSIHFFALYNYVIIYNDIIYNNIHSIYILCNAYIPLMTLA